MPEPQPVIRAISAKQPVMSTNLELGESAINHFLGSELRG